MKTETKKQAKSAQKNAIALTRETQSATQDLNNVFTTSNQVSPMMQTHYVNMATGEHGVTALIKEVLEENCVVPACIVNEGDKAHYADDKSVSTANVHEFRKVAIAQAMFTCDIVSAVQSKWTAGTIRYPKETIEMYLSVWLVRAGFIGKVKLTKHEDIVNRPADWSKPRNKWFIIQGKEKVKWTQI